MQTQNMYELAEQLKQLREKKKNAEQRLKEMNAEIEQADYQLSMLMAETETQNFTRAGTTFALTTFCCGRTQRRTVCSLERKRLRRSGL